MYMYYLFHLSLQCMQWQTANDVSLTLFIGDAKNEAIDITLVSGFFSCNYDLITGILYYYWLLDCYLILILLTAQWFQTQMTRPECKKIAQLKCITEKGNLKYCNLIFSYLLRLRGEPCQYFELPVLGIQLLN